MILTGPKLFAFHVQRLTETVRVKKQEIVRFHLHGLLFVNSVLKCTRDESARSELAHFEIRLGLKIKRRVVPGVHVRKSLRRVIERRIEERDVVLTVRGVE